MTAPPSPARVFLGGACGTTTWRRDIAIPMLEQAGVTYHNPQLPPGAWTEEHEQSDMAAKTAATVLLFVISAHTRGVASIAEVAYLIGQGRPLALALEDIPAGAEGIAADERSDLNRGRLFLRTMAGHHGVPVFDTVQDATAHAIELAQAAESPLGMDAMRALLADIDCSGLAFSADPAPGGYFLRVIGPGPMEGRNWFLPSTANASDVIRTAFKAAVTWAEHETREMFRYRGDAIFGPHIDVERLRRATRD